MSIQKISVKRVNPDYLMMASNERGYKITLDASPKIGGRNMGMRPMELLLAGIGSCSMIDIISILKKQRQDLEDIQVSVEAERADNEVPSLFQKIHLHYHLSGNLDENKVQKAIDLSVNKYCSVARILEKTAEISYSFQIDS